MNKPPPLIKSRGPRNIIIAKENIPGKINKRKQRNTTWSHLGDHPFSLKARPPKK